MLSNICTHKIRQVIIKYINLYIRGEIMSEFLCCDRCGELSMYDSTTYIENKPICPTCFEQMNYVLQTADSEENY